jgi:23S rRNA G2069 N7-methylase RlmK/C1962 C5-methylase RlmI
MSSWVNRKAADRVASGHPWIFSSDVEDRGGAGPGAVVHVVEHRGRMLFQFGLTATVAFWSRCWCA